MFEDTTTTVPLTATQKTRLIFDCVPAVFFVVMFIFIWQIWPAMTEFQPPPALLLLLGLAILLLGYQSVQRIRDLTSGVAYVETDVMKRSRRSGRRGSGGHIGEFERLGRLYMKASMHAQVHDGQRCRVTYSPTSKIVWSLEAVDAPYTPR